MLLFVVRYKIILITVLLSIGGALRTLQSQQKNDLIFDKQYFKLGQYLIEYMEVVNQGGWPIIPHKPLREGDRDSSVLLLRHRLAKEKYIAKSTSNEPVYFDHELAMALKKFQASHGLSVTGDLGEKTIKALNVSAQQKVDQLSLNMERWVFLPDFNNLSSYILVNIPDYKMFVYCCDSQLIEEKVMVGRLDRKTPTFTAPLHQVIFNPTWNVPPVILKEDVISRLKNDANYLKRHNMYLLTVKDGKTAEITYDSIDWVNISPTYFPYVLIQKAGPTNALGRVKFVFPNKYSVYMHDTPSKYLFGVTQRTLSSGCIRVDNALGVAKVLLATDNPNWSSEQIDKIIKSGKTYTISLKQPVPVFIIYVTAWVDQEGQLQFRNDVYHKDKLAPLNY